jgi:monoamine oxidase
VRLRAARVRGVGGAVKETGISRRRFVAGAAATGAAAAIPGRAAAASGPADPTRSADVVVVGAGFAGLTAARAVAGAGASVIVLEARNRVGGRVLNHGVGGGKISEAGGTFLGATQDHVLGLAKQLGVATFPTYDTGDNVYVANGRRMTYSDATPLGMAPPDPTILPDVVEVVKSLDRMSREVPVDAPWEAPDAHRWDSQTLESWLEANTANPQAREFLRSPLRAIFGCETRDLSLLFTLAYIAGAGNEQNPGTFERVVTTRDGAHAWRVVGGTGLIAERIGAELGSGRVVLGSPVRQIAQTDAGVDVRSDRLTVRAKQAIVAIPPTLAGRIDYQPALPFERDQLTQRCPQGAETKVACVYDSPFWRSQGLNGVAISLGAPLSVTFDDSPPDGSPGILFGYVAGDNLRGFSAISPAARRAAVIDNLVTFFGSQAANPREYLESNWASEPWTRGCPLGILGPGALVAYGSTLREPVGRIHWAGAETSTYWYGYMDGAVRSGARAAAEALKAL